MIYLAKVEEVFGILPGSGNVRQVKVSIEGKTGSFIRNVFGPVKVGNLIHLVDITKEEKLKGKKKR